MLDFQHIQPDFSPQTADEFDAARRNFRWWSSNFQLIADKNAPAPHLFYWNTIQQRLNYTFNANRDVFGGGRYIIVKARQMGVSTLVTNRSAWNACRGPHYRALHFAHESDATGLMLSMVKMSYYGLPKVVTMPNGEDVLVRPREKRSNKDELDLWFDVEGILTSNVRVKTAGGASGAGRGFAMNLVHFSEFNDHTAYDDGEIVTGALQTTSRTAEVFAEGTPNGAYGIQYEMYRDAKSGDNNWIPIFLPWFWMEEYSVPLLDGEVIEPDNEFEYKLMHGENTHEGFRVRPAQIKWMRWKIKSDCPKTIEMTPLQWFMQEYAHNDTECFLTKGQAYFVQDYVEKARIKAEEYEKQHEIMRYEFDGHEWVRARYGRLRLIEEPDPNATYVIGGDSAQGLEHGDYDTATIIKRCRTGPDWIVGYWRAKQPDKGLHALGLAKLGEWHNTALIAVENNPKGHGDSVNQTLDQLHYPRLYIQARDDEGSFGAGIKSQYGLYTSAKSKSIYLGDQQKALRAWYENSLHPDGVFCPFTAIIEEWRTFQHTRGRTEAAKGCYDDLVISTGIATHIRTDVAVGDGDMQKRDPHLIKAVEPTAGQALNFFGHKTAQQMIDENDRTYHG